MAARIAPVKSTAPRRPRQRKNDHLAWSRTLPCLVCGAVGTTEAAHVRMACLKHAKSETGIGRKPSDMYTVPLCNQCHTQQHSFGEAKWWRTIGIEPCDVALRLWAHTGDYEAGLTIIRNAR